MITFKPITSLKRGEIFDILTRCYQDLANKYDSKNKEKYLESWKQSEKNAFDNQAIGKCVLVTHLDDKPIGFVSYDPRHFPNYGIIGQNCVLPEYQGKGYGKLQLQELFKIFKEAGCRKALVSTGNNDFFIPAQKMYEVLGFKETGRHLNENWGFEEIEYEKTLD